MFIVLSIYALIKMFYMLNIYQQSHYKLKSYFIYFLKSSLYNDLFIILMFFVSYLLEYLIVDIIVGIYIILYALIFYRRTRITLKVTKRIIRQILILIIYIPLFYLIPKPYSYFGLMLFEFTSVIPLFMTNILEKINNLRYVRTSSKKLKDYRGMVIAITGSFGKTSTKHYLGSILNNYASTLYTEKSYNTPLGIATSLNNNDIFIYDNLILEFGATKIRDISYLFTKYKPKVGILTSIGLMHLDSFKNIDNIIYEKTRIIELLGSSDVGFINVENEYIRNYSFKTKANLVRYGINYGEYQARNIINEDKIVFDVYYKDDYLCKIESRLLGEHNIINLLLCISYCHYFNLDLNKAIKQIKLIDNVSNRLSFKKYNDYVLYDDSFNANINGAISALKILKEAKGKRFLITPGFVEMKNKALELNERFSKSIKDSCDVCILVGVDETKDLYERLKGYDILVYVSDSMKEAFWMFYLLKEKNSYLLVENDLPDIYLRRKLL